MSASKSSAEQQSELQQAFSALVDCLRKAFRERGTVSIPNAIVAPFRKPFVPTDSAALHDLARVLENGHPHKNIARLDANSFYYIVSIVLHFPYSVVQNKLLYLFMDIVRQYKNERTLTSVLSRIHSTKLTPADIKEQGDFVGRKLSSRVLLHLVSRGTPVQLRWRLAQFLSVLIHFSSAARDQIMGMTECLHLTTILEADPSHFLRILVADAIRGLLYNGAEPVVFGKSAAARKMIKMLPRSKNGGSKWMSDLVDYLRQIDLAKASTVERDRIYSVQRLDCDSNKFVFESPSPFVASVPEGVSFLLPQSADTGMIALCSVPASRQISVDTIASQSDPSTILEICYPDDKADRIVNGIRSAISSLKVTFCDEEDVEAFKQAIEERCNKNTSATAPKAPGTPKKQSFAIIDIDSASGDEDIEEGHTANTMATSEVDGSSPLRGVSRRKSLSRPQKHIAGMSNLEVQAGEDTPALKKRPDPRPLIQRLLSSQEERTEPISKAGSGSKQLQVRRSPRTIDSAEGATAKKQLPHLLADESASDQLPKVKINGKRPAEAASILLSNQAKKRSKPSVTKGQASNDADTQNSSRNSESLKDNMARITGAEKDDSQASTESAKPGLKRRANKGPTTAKAEQPQKASKTASKAVEFDLPPSDDEDIPPIKKAKTKTTKPAVKATVKEPAGKKKSGTQVTAPPKGGKKKETDKSKAKKSQETEAPTTAASNRARRAAKTPKYIVDSDEDEDDGVEVESDHDQEVEDDPIDDNDQETAEDSYPAEKGTHEAATHISQAEFESQLLPDMADRESTGDEARPSEKRPQNSAARERTALKELPISQNLPKIRKHAAADKEPLVQKTTAKQPVLRDHIPVRNPIAAKGPVLVADSSVQDPRDEQSILERNLPVQKLPRKQTPAKAKPSEQVFSRQKATPQRNTKRLSEISIPPTSEKLLRKTPIVHFGPQGPANQAVQRTSEGEGAQYSITEDDGHSDVLATQADEGSHLEETDELVQQPSHSHGNTTSNLDPAQGSTQSGPVHDSFEFLSPSQPADGTDMGYLDEGVQMPSAKAVVKSPEVNETQPRSPQEDSIEAEVAERDSMSDEPQHEIEDRHNEVQTTQAGIEEHVEIEDIQAETSKSHTIDTDNESSVDKSYDQHASEYVPSEAEAEARVHSVPAPEPQLSRRPDNHPSRAQTPLFDEEAPARGYQRTKEQSVSRKAIRQSIGVSAIIDKGHPTAQKVINTQKLRPDRQPDAVPATGEARRSSAALPETVRRPKKSGTLETATAMAVKEVRKSSKESAATSVPAGKARVAEKSNEHGLMSQSRQERGQSATFHRAVPDLESAVEDAEEPAAKRRKQTLTRAHLKAASDMSSTSTLTRSALPMAPPPLPQALPSRATRKPDPPRKSWPESRSETTTRLAQAATKQPSKPAEPVRIKKRLTLPLAANEPLHEADFAPATPASFSTRLDLHANLPKHVAHNDEDSRMQDAGQKLGNGSITLVNEDDSFHGDRPTIWTRAGHRQHSEPDDDDDVSMAASPSRNKGHVENRHISMVGKLTARDSQQGLLAAIISVTNDVLFRFGDEEDAIKAKVDEYNRGGKAVVETLVETWSQRLEHEHNILQDGLKAEEEFLITAARLLTEKHTGGAWKRVIADDGLPMKMQKKGSKLAKQIEAMMG